MFKFVVFIVLLGVVTSPIFTLNIRDTSSQTNGGLTFDLYLQRVNRHNATKMCEEGGGELAIIRSSADENNILKMMARYSVNDVWIGWNSSTEYGSTTASSGSRRHVDPSRWRYNGSHGGCALFTDSGNGIIEYDCKLPQRFVCQFPTV